MKECQFCKRECKNDNSHRNHERCCPKNSMRSTPVNGNKGKTAWNKGKSYVDLYGEERAKGLKQFHSQFIREHPANNWSLERREKASQARKELLQRRPELHPNRLLANNRQKMSYPEKLIYEKLSDLGWKFEHQKRVLRFFVDFYLPDLNILLEIDGIRWHDEERDRIRDQKILAEMPNSKIIRLTAKNVLEHFNEQVLMII